MTSTIVARAVGVAMRPPEKSNSTARTPVAEVCAVAKRDLAPGERLDAIGEYAYRAWIMTASDAAQAHAVPCGLLEGGKVTKPIRKGELLTSGNCAADASSRIVALRKRQDDMLKGILA